MSVFTLLHHEIQCFIWINAVLYPHLRCPGKGCPWCFYHIIVRTAYSYTGFATQVV